MAITNGTDFRRWAKDMAKLSGSELRTILNLLSRRENADEIIKMAVDNNWTKDVMMSLLAPAIPVPAPAQTQPDPALTREQHHAQLRDQAATSAPQTSESAGEIQAQPKVVGETKPSFFARAWNWVKSLMFKDKAEAAPQEAKPAKKSMSKKTMVIAGSVAVLALLVFALVGYNMYSGGGSSGQYDFSNPVPVQTLPGSPTGLSTLTPGLDPLATETVPAPVDPDVSFWSDLKRYQVPETSPGNLGWQFSAKTAIGALLMLFLSFEAYGEGKIRKKGQNGASLFTTVALLAGWLTMPVLMLMSATKLMGWFVFGSLFLGVLWAMTASTVWSQNDLTPITVALALFTSSLFFVGKLAIISAIGVLFGAVWPAWVGVTTLGGVITLLMTSRASMAILTILITFLGIIVIYMASIEVGKKHGKWSALMIGLAIIIIFSLTNWGLSALVQYFVNTQNLTIMITVVLKVLVPILSWFISLVSAIGFGVAMGDVEVGRAENRQSLGLEKTGTFIQNIADFAILGTIIPLFLGVIIALV